MDAKQTMALGLLAQMQELFLGYAAREIVLRHVALEGDDYADLVENAEILMADKVRAVFEPLRALCGEHPEPDHLPSDLDSVVRRALDSLQGGEFWEE